MIDAHAHLDFDPLYDDIEGVIARAHEAGVEAIISAGYDHTHHTRHAELCARHGIFVAAGVHPWAVAELDEQGLHSALEELAERLDSGEFIAVGECGLDYHRVTDKAGRALQREAFIKQLELAREHKLPAIVHAVKSHDEVYSILSQHAPERGVQLHGYSGHASLIPRLAQCGAVFSFGSPLTWSGQRKIKDALWKAVEECDVCWMLETDAPDRPVDGVEGHGQPADLDAVIESAAQLLGWSVEEVARVSAENARRFFGLSESTTLSGGLDAR